ncbi:MAG TPA: LuxR C-terminal-related transcriptional regulator, partial [Acidimicrobiales bacterium]
AEGLSNAEVARRLYISPKTAAVHVSNILMKLGMSSRAEVAAWAVRSGLVGPEPAASGSAVRRRAAGEPIAERSE